MGKRARRLYWDYGVLFCSGFHLSFCTLGDDTFFDYAIGDGVTFYEGLVEGMEEGGEVGDEIISARCSVSGIFCSVFLSCLLLLNLWLWKMVDIYRDW